MKISELFPARFAYGADFQGKALRVTISQVRLEKVHPPAGPAADKPILYMVGTDRGIILTRTLARQIVQLTGHDETTAWKGRTIVLFPVPMQVAGKGVIAIRARAPASTNGDADPAVAPGLQDETETAAAAASDPDDSDELEFATRIDG